jgi:hypothetical protein
VPVPSQENAEVVEPGDYALELDAVDEENRERRLVLPNVVQKRILEALHSFCGHLFSIHVCAVSRFLSLVVLGIMPSRHVRPTR